MSNKKKAVSAKGKKARGSHATAATGDLTSEQKANSAPLSTSSPKGQAGSGAEADGVREAAALKQQGADVATAGTAKAEASGWKEAAAANKLLMGDSAAADMAAAQHAGKWAEQRRKAEVARDQASEVARAKVSEDACKAEEYFARRKQVEAIVAAKKAEWALEEQEQAAAVITAATAFFNSGTSSTATKSSGTSKGGVFANQPIPLPLPAKAAATQTMVAEPGPVVNGPESFPLGQTFSLRGGTSTPLPVVASSAVGPIGAEVTNLSAPAWRRPTIAPKSWMIPKSAAEVGPSGAAKESSHLRHAVPPTIASPVLVPIAGPSGAADKSSHLRQTAAVSSGSQTRVPVAGPSAVAPPKAGLFESAPSGQVGLPLLPWSQVTQTKVSVAAAASAASASPEVPVTSSVIFGTPARVANSGSDVVASTSPHLDDKPSPKNGIPKGVANAGSSVVAAAKKKSPVSTPVNGTPTGPAIGKSAVVDKTQRKLSSTPPLPKAIQTGVSKADTAAMAPCGPIDGTPAGVVNAASASAAPQKPLDGTLTGDVTGTSAVVAQPQPQLPTALAKSGSVVVLSKKPVDGNRPGLATAQSPVVVQPAPQHPKGLDDGKSSMVAEAQPHGPKVLAKRGSAVAVSKKPTDRTDPANVSSVDVAKPEPQPSRTAPEPRPEPKRRAEGVPGKKVVVSQPRVKAAAPVIPGPAARTPIPAAQPVPNVTATGVLRGVERRRRITGSVFHLALILVFMLLVSYVRHTPTTDPIAAHEPSRTGQTPEQTVVPEPPRAKWARWQNVIYVEPVVVQAPQKIVVPEPSRAVPAPEQSVTDVPPAVVEALARTPEVNQYDVLGVAPDASVKEIERAFFTLLKRARHGRAGSDPNLEGTQANGRDRLLKLGDAYRVLTSNSRRRVHDFHVLPKPADIEGRLEAYRPRRQSGDRVEDAKPSREGESDAGHLHPDDVVMQPPSPPTTPKMVESPAPKPSLLIAAPPTPPTTPKVESSAPTPSLSIAAPPTPPTTPKMVESPAPTPSLSIAALPTPRGVWQKIVAALQSCPPSAQISPPPSLYCRITAELRIRVAEIPKAFRARKRRTLRIVLAWRFLLSVHQTALPAW